MTNLVTQFLRASEGAFAQSIHRFQPEWAGAVATGLNAALARAPFVSPYFRSNLTLNQLFVSVMNTGWLLWDLAKLSAALQQKQISNKGRIALLISTTAAGVFLHFAGEWVHRKNNPLVLEEERPEVTVSYVSRHLQSCSQALILTRTIINMAITCFSPQRSLWEKCNVLGLGYSYLKSAQIKWLKVSYTFNGTEVDVLQREPNRLYMKALRFDYAFPLFPNGNRELKCVICQEDNPPFEFDFHAPSHLTCLVQNLCMVFQNVKQLTPSFIRKETVYIANFEAQESHLPSCFMCKKTPDNHTVDLQYFDQDLSKGHFTTTLEWAHDPNAVPIKSPRMDSLWARVAAVYSVFQAALAIMQQRHPDIAGKIAAARELLMLFDLGAIAHHYHQLYKIFYEKYVVAGARAAAQAEVDVAASEAAFQAANTRLQQATLAINQAITRREILKIHRGSRVAVSEEADAVIQSAEEAFTNGHIVLNEQNVWQPQNEMGQAVLGQLIQMVRNGEIINIHEHYIPLSPNAIEVNKRWQMLMVSGKIEYDESSKTYTFIDQEAQSADQEFDDAVDRCELARLVDGMLPLSPQGKQVMEAYQQAWQDGKIRIHNDEVQPDEEAQGICQAFNLAVQNFDILLVQPETKMIPITPQAKELLKQSNAEAITYQLAFTQMEEARTAYVKRHKSLQERCHAELQGFMLMSGIGLAVISTIAIAFFNTRPYRTVNLMEMLKKVVLPKDFKNIKISGSVEVSVAAGLAQWLILHRIFLNALLIYFSPDKKSYALSLLAQAVTLWQGPSRSNLMINVKRGHSYTGPITKRIVTNFNIRVPLLPVTGCASLSDHVQAHVKSIYDYTTKLLEGSSWRRNGPNSTWYSYWFNQTLRSAPLAPCGCGLAGVVESAIASR